MSVISVEAPRVFSTDQLARRACKWPIGVPGSDSFSFCGGSCDLGASYCAGHNATAHQPGHNPRRTVRELERSLSHLLG